MNKRQDYIKCIAHSHANQHIGMTWCGRTKEGWAFVDPTHAAYNGLQEGRLVACPECVNAVTRALQNGMD